MNCTPEMIRAGKKAFGDTEIAGSRYTERALQSAYRAMREQDPVIADLTEALTRAEAQQDLRTVEFRLALSRITEAYPPDTEAGRIAAEALAKHPNRFAKIGGNQ